MQFYGLKNPVGMDSRQSPIIWMDSRPSPPNTDANGGTDGRPAIPTISSFVAGFKSAATKRINEYRNTPKTPVWQKLFHDRIIRDANEYNRIFNYIKNNIEKW
jgi:hypothetical protein